MMTNEKSKTREMFTVDCADRKRFNISFTVLLIECGRFFLFSFAVADKQKI